MTREKWYALGVVVGISNALVILFGTAALGIVGDGGAPDLLYVGAVVTAVLGALVARFRAAGMVVALGVAAVGVVIAGVAAFAGGLVDDGASGDVVMLTAGFACGFGLSAWLFQRAADAGAELVA